MVSGSRSENMVDLASVFLHPGMGIRARRGRGLRGTGLSVVFFVVVQTGCTGEKG